MSTGWRHAEAGDSRVFQGEAGHPSVCNGSGRDDPQGRRDHNLRPAQKRGQDVTAHTHIFELGCVYVCFSPVAGVTMILLRLWCLAPEQLGPVICATVRMLRLTTVSYLGLLF